MPRLRLRASKSAGARIRQEVLRNYARWVDEAAGVEVWLPENQLGNLC
jgi:bisphosphoglycerate-independent phosphoglycerate mutase (AlkP superfamily)